MGQGDLSAGCKAMMHLNQALQGFVAPYFTGIGIWVIYMCSGMVALLWL